MLGLPPELWEHIFLFLREPKDLRAVSEVSRLFNQISAPLCWSSLSVSGFGASAGFSKISSSPHLARHVKRIQFGGAGCDTHLLRMQTRDMAHVCTWALRDSHRQLYNMKDLISYTVQLQGTLYSPTWPTTIKVLCWQAPEEKLSDLVHFRMSNGLRTDLSIFPRLTSVETSTAIFLQWDGTTDPVAAHRKARRQNPEFAEAESPDMYLPFNRLLRGAQIMATSISRISICKLQEILALYYGRDWPPTAFCNVNHLKIDLSTSTWKDSQEYLDCLAKQLLLSPWLRLIQGLKTLTFLQNPWMEPAINVLGHLILLLKPQAIRRIEFINITTHPANLEQFIDLHCERLESLRICEPVMSEIGWNRFRSATVGKWRSIQEIHIGDTYLPQGMSRSEWENRGSTIISRGF